MRNAPASSLNRSRLSPINAAFASDCSERAIAARVFFRSSSLAITGSGRAGRSRFNSRNAAPTTLTTSVARSMRGASALNANVHQR